MATQRPSPALSPGLLATQLSGGQTFSDADLPTQVDAWIWLMLNLAAGCVVDADAAYADRRADAFATLATTLIDGDPVIAQQGGVGPGRYWEKYRFASANHWATNVGERYLLDIMKSQVASVSKTMINCTLTPIQSTRLDTDAIVRENVTPADGCTSYGGGGSDTGNVTDANLWDWMYQTPIGAPPNELPPLVGFADAGTAFTWTWNSASSLAKQYPQ